MDKEEKPIITYNGKEWTKSQIVETLEITYKDIERRLSAYRHGKIFLIDVFRRKSERTQAKAKLRKCPICWRQLCVLAAETGIKANTLWRRG